MTNVAVICLIMNGYDDKINKYIYKKETIASICKTKKIKRLSNQVEEGDIDDHLYIAK